MSPHPESHNVCVRHMHGVALTCLMLLIVVACGGGSDTPDAASAQQGGAGSLVAVTAQAVNVSAWTGIREDGAPEFARDSALAVATDPFGNVAIAGTTNNAFAPPTGTRVLNPFVAKYSAQGTLLWAHLIVRHGSPALGAAHGVATDSAGSIYVTGDTAGVLPGETQAGGRDIFVAKYDPGGNVLWARQFGSLRTDNAHAIAVDGNGNAFIVGHANGPLPLQPPNQGGDFFIAKFDTNGNRLWINQSGSAATNDQGLGVAVDAAGNAYMTGTVAGPFAGTATTGAGHDAYVAKYDTNGNRLWFSRVASRANDTARGVAVSDDGSAIYLTGYTNGDFDLPGYPSQTISCCTTPDAFVARLDLNGAIQWAHNLSSLVLEGSRYFDDRAFGIATDAAGSALFITGYTNGVMPGEASKGARDVFVARYEGDGSRTWVRQLGSGFPAEVVMNDEAFGIALDPNGDVFVAGEAVGTFGTPNPDIDRTDWFVLKMKPADGSLY